MKWLTLSLLLGAWACSDEERSTPDAGMLLSDSGTTIDRDGGGTGVDASGGGAVETRSVSIGPFATPAGVERTQCASFDLGNDEPMFVRAIRTRLTAGSHHMIVYRLDEPADPTPSNCGSFSHGVSDSIFIAQQLEASIAYPTGTGLRVDAHQTIGLEMHYINYTGSGPIDIGGTVELDLVPIDGAIDEMQLAFTGDIAVSIPPRSDATFTSFHAIPPGARLFALTSHTHQLGTRATIHRGTSETSLGALLHESTSWAEPPLDTFEPMIVLDPGEGLVLTCSYHNPTGSTVGFGTGFDDEMCFLWAHYVL